MTQTQTYTNEQVNANFKEALNIIKPATLVNLQADGHAITALMLKNKMAPTPDNFVKAITALRAQLVWGVKPALLLREEANKRPAVVESPIKVNEQRADMIKEAEQRDKIAKEHAALVKQCEELIAAYAPYTKAGRRDAREQEESQARWRATLAEAKKKNDVARIRGYRNSLVTTIQQRYAGREKAMERL